MSHPYPIIASMKSAAELLRAPRWGTAEADALTAEVRAVKAKHPEVMDTQHRAAHTAAEATEQELSQRLRDAGGHPDRLNDPNYRKANESNQAKRELCDRLRDARGQVDTLWNLYRTEFNENVYRIATQGA